MGIERNKALPSNNRTTLCIVTAQSLHADQATAADQSGRAYQLTKQRFAGEWSALHRGDVVELTLTCESVPQTLNARLVAPRGSDAMSAHEFETLVGKVLGRGTEPPYVLVECHGANQYVVNRRVFAGDWDALANGDSVVLAVSGGACARVLTAWFEVPPSTPTGTAKS